MQFARASILLASLATLGSAAPLNNNETLTELELVERGAPKAYCAYKFHPTFPYVGIYVPNNLMGSAQGTGSCKFRPSIPCRFLPSSRLLGSLTD